MRARSLNIKDLLTADDIGDKKREHPAVPQKYPPGSEVSLRLKELTTQDEEHRLRTFPQIAREAGVQAADSTIYRIMHQHHSLYCYRPRHKPPLDATAKQNRLRLVDWALTQPIESFVYTDEMMLEVGAPQGHKRVTREKGQDPYQVPIHDKKKGNGFSIMVSGSISLGFKGPLWIWVKETAEERQENAQALREENLQTTERIARRRANALIPGTEEHAYIQALNREIDQYNANHGTNDPRRQHRRPYWEFKEEVRGRSAGGGMDWFLYRKHALQERVYPFIERIQVETGRQCWLVEDKAGNHTAAARMDHEAQARGIRRIPFWPPNSPDLNEIEPCWNYLKDSMAQYNFIGSGEETKQRVQEALYAEWDRMPQDLIDRFCMNFHVNLLQVRACGGDNKFNGYWSSAGMRRY